jgi:FtsZ-binding cell division protein ZapB
MKLSSPNSNKHGIYENLDENSNESDVLKPKSSFKEEDSIKLQSELKDVKEKLRIITQKFTSVRKERDSLKKETKELQNEILSLQSSMHEMVPAFSNTSSIYPMHNELQTMVSDFMKCPCDDIFFDYLSPELSMEGVVYFFKEAIFSIHKIVSVYFEPVAATLSKAICNETLGGPFSSVLKKAYQNNWKRILTSCVPLEKCEEVMNNLQSKLHLKKDSQVANKEITQFIRKLSEIYLLCYICEPEFVFAKETIGNKVAFNAVKHESIDGFLKSKEQCIIILPAVYKATITGEIIAKAHVLTVNYEFI